MWSKSLRFHFLREVGSHFFEDLSVAIRTFHPMRHLYFFLGQGLSARDADVHLCTFTESLYRSLEDFAGRSFRDIGASGKCCVTLRTLPDACGDALHSISSALGALMSLLHRFLYLFYPFPQFPSVSGTKLAHSIASFNMVRISSPFTFASLTAHITSSRVNPPISPFCMAHIRLS